LLLEYNILSHKKQFSFKTAQFRHKYHLSASIKDAFGDCLNRLYRKIERHADNPQLNKISNFVIIFSSLYSLIRFIDTVTIFNKYKWEKVITPDNWFLIREYYDMLLMYINQSWKLLWSNGGYRDAISRKIIKDRSNSFNNFEQYLAGGYKYLFDESIKFAIQTVKHFEHLKNSLFVETLHGEKVKPPISKNNHPYLQPDMFKKCRVEINKLANKFLPNADITNTHE